MYILGLDFETTFTDPIDPKKSRIIEVGAVLWDTLTSRPLKFYSAMVWHPSYEWDNRIKDLTGLDLFELNKFGRPLRQVLEELFWELKDAKYVLAHNALGFDKPLLEAELARAEVDFPALKWIDTAVDVPYPAKIETRKLEFLCAAHGFINPFGHRALGDVLSMLKIVSHYDFNLIASQSEIPNVMVKAEVTKPWEDGGQSSSVAKANGFRWDGVNKIWGRRVKANQLAKLQAECLKLGLKVSEGKDDV